METELLRMVANEVKDRCRLKKRQVTCVINHIDNTIDVWYNSKNNPKHLRGRCIGAFYVYPSQGYVIVRLDSFDQATNRNGLVFLQDPECFDKIIDALKVR